MKRIDLVEYFILIGIALTSGATLLEVRGLGIDFSLHQDVWLSTIVLTFCLAISLVRLGQLLIISERS